MLFWKKGSRYGQDDDVYKIISKGTHNFAVISFQTKVRRSKWLIESYELIVQPPLECSCVVDCPYIVGQFMLSGHGGLG